ncbi:heme lyase CcmF/NrfE family subunit [Suttonella sp. R2A3]|uniref:heme lyase CcmF/NrfE family subunit n=1 Tax=Suttonella sp. R2A3 TaxID=2908648 RepID=UPI001F17EECE|nr:heme lyase CcmF/NrfE family subunit [Suttonella sp. R2A3]UJF24738.1 heme lyase CcmF/NrfE family subunit [Suttonella sp. R2A3]
MTGELGHLTLLLAGGLALLQCLLPVFSAHNARAQSIVLACAKGQFYLLSVSMLALGYAFYANDFTLYYVANHSNSLLPWYYRLSAIWGGHEGSLLLWIYILSIWSAAVAWRSASLPALFRTRVLAVLGYISVGFVAFIVLTSNPFARQFPFPFDGHDLNPLLQDPGLIFHPPLLYAGYVGFAVAFAFVVAGLWQGRLDSLWLKRARPWTLAAWLTLTLGITLGSYWAYYELGWGGWWFWDPVENASLMPWLIGTALIHSLSASDRRGAFMIWTSLLAILAFALSLIGTFLVRSGVLTSVHAFASDPTRGIFILALLVAITLPALVLLILRSAQLSRSVSYGLLSRETGLLANNWLMTGACVVVFIGTLYPLVADILNLGKISVGAPYFNRLIVPLALISLLLLGFMPLLRWHRDRASRLKNALIFITVFALIFTLGIGWWLLPDMNMMTYLALFVSGLAFAAVCADTAKHLRRGTRTFSRSLIGMLSAHLGYIIMALAITATGTYSNEQDISIRAGDEVGIADYRISLLSLREEKGPNYQATQGLFRISKNDDDDFFTVLTPAKRQYFSSTMPMTESSRLVTPTHDLYLAMGEEIGPGNWAVRLQYKPFIIWIWLGALLMAIGGGIAALDRSYRQARNVYV